MRTKVTIRKILITMIWLIVGAGMITLLVAAISKKNREICQDYSISVNGSDVFTFLDENDITTLLKTALGGEIRGKRIADFHLDKLEQLLEDNHWIRDAELWFDNKGKCHVMINEREPVARIFTTGGISFYIDSTNKMMPLSEKVSLRVPVFTGFPEKRILNSQDSLLLQQVKETAVFIKNNPFWMSQVAQIDITADRKMEMIPVVGNHVVKLGTGTNLEKKFHRLFVFYSQVLSRTGFDKYSTIDVQYARQVIGTRKGKTPSKVDMGQLRKNVEKLLNEQKQIQQDTINRAEVFKQKAIQGRDSVTVTGKAKEIEETRKPKAVMPSKNGHNN